MDNKRVTRVNGFHIETRSLIWAIQYMYIGSWLHKYMFDAVSN